MCGLLHLLLVGAVAAAIPFLLLRWWALGVAGKLARRGVTVTYGRLWGAMVKRMTLLGVVGATLPVLAGRSAEQVGAALGGVIVGYLGAGLLCTLACLGCPDAPGRPRPSLVFLQGSG